MALFTHQKIGKLSPMPTFRIRKEKKPSQASPLSSPLLSDNRKTKSNAANYSGNSSLQETFKRVTNMSKHLSNLDEKCQSIEDLSEDAEVKVVKLSETASLVIPVNQTNLATDLQYSTDSIYENISIRDEVYENITLDQEICKAIKKQDEVLRQLCDVQNSELDQTEDVYVSMSLPNQEQETLESRGDLTQPKAVEIIEDCYGTFPVPAQNHEVNVKDEEKKAQEDTVILRREQMEPRDNNFNEEEETVILRKKPAELQNNNLNTEKSRQSEAPVVPPRKDKRRQLVTLKRKTDALVALGNLVEKGVDPTDRYLLGDEVDSGASGMVFIGRDKRTDAVVAIKIIDIQSQSHLGLIVKELEALCMLKHSCIVNYISSYMQDDKLWIVMEYLDGGSLTKLCKYMELDECAIATITRDILLGIESLHSHRIIHRDIKSDNVLIGSDGRIKLTDFGFCAQLKCEDDVRKTLGGTPYWMSPEVIQQSNYTEKTDIWSLGILIVEMLQGEPPYMKDPPFIAMQKIIKKGRPKLDKSIKVSSDLDKFLDLCLQTKPEKRASASELLKHTFITKNAVQTTKLRPLLEELIKTVYCD